nr:nucleolin-like [Coffea arabica]
MEEQQSEGHPVSDNEEEPVQPTNADVTVTKSPKKEKRTAKRKSIAQPKEKQTVDPSRDQQNAEKTTEEQQTEEPSARRSPRTRSGVQSVAQIAQRSRKRKRPEQLETHTATEPTHLPKFIDDETREKFEWISKGKSHTDLISRVNSVNIELNPDIVNSNKGKAPATGEEIEEEDDDDEDEDTEKEDLAQFRLARRKPGSSKSYFRHP